MFKGARVLAAMAAAAACGFVVGVADASAASLFLCVPSTQGQPAVSGGSSASGCATGTTAVNASVLSHASYTDSGIDGKPTITFSGVNVQVVSGSGSTSGTINGEGNLIIGYAENTSGYPQSGSHDLIVGSNNGWKSYGEVVGGFGNQATAKYAAAVGTGNLSSGAFSLSAGGDNTAAGNASSATGGRLNHAQNSYSAVSGGEFNLASDPFSSVSGGCQGVAGAATALTGSCAASGYESILGGALNRAQGSFSAVSAGLLNQANGYSTAVSGGDHNTAGSSSTGNYASVTGGGGNSAGGDESAITGGQYNATNDDDSFVGGGCDNLAGVGTPPTGNCVNSDSGLEDGHDVVLGGYANQPTGFGSSIAGGDQNHVTGAYGSISGGSANAASSPAGWIGGGAHNTAATGAEASIAGGQSNSATGSFSSILGGNGISLGTDNGVSPAGLVSSLTGHTGFSLAANSCGSFVLGDGDLQVGDVPLFAYTTTPPTGHMLFSAGAVLSAGKATYTVCNDSSSAGTFSGNVHIVAFRG